LIDRSGKEVDYQNIQNTTGEVGGFKTPRDYSYRKLNVSTAKNQQLWIGCSVFSSGHFDSKCCARNDAVLVLTDPIDATSKRDSYLGC